MDTVNRKILVLGASGLIGRFVTDDLRVRGFPVVGVARKLSASQKSGPLDLELPVISMEAPMLARLLRDHRIDVVVNCLGVLQDGPGSDTSVVHCDFVARLLQAIRDTGRAIRLIHILFPGPPARTAPPSV
jgi:nucleoside-diphosphate-sugar epimerase